MAAIAKAILGKKLGMSQLFLDTGQLVPVTVIEAGPCVVVQRKTKEKEGYEAVQLGFGEVRTGRGGKPRMTAPLSGHFDKAGLPAKRTLAEFRMADCELLEVGDEIRADIFQADEKVEVIGISKGKGFAGAQKRHGFHGGPRTHGSTSHRRPASGGATAAARTIRGARKPGRMGAVRVTARGLTVIRSDAEKNLLLIKGAVPGAPGGVVAVTHTLKPKETAPDSLPKQKAKTTREPREKTAAGKGS